MTVEREVESLIFDDGEVGTHERERQPVVDVEIERDPLVLTSDDAAALPPAVEDVAHLLHVDPQGHQHPRASAAPEALLDGAGDNTTPMLLGSLAVAVLLALLAVLLARRASGKKKGSDVLLVGPSDGGKTALFAALVHGRPVPTHTSMQANIAYLPSPTKSKTRLVDVPGHPRLRAQGLADHLPAAKGVLFVVDAASVARNGAAVAEHLHEVLAALLALPSSSSPPPVAIVAAKLDLAPQGAARVRSVLERELERRRAARVDVEKDDGGLGEGGGGLGGLETVGPRGAPFRFAEWEGGEVGVLGCSVRRLGVGEGGVGSEGEKEGKEGVGLEEVRAWIEGLE